MLAEKLAQTASDRKPPRKDSTQRGPLSSCGPVYGEHEDLDHSNLEDWTAVEAQRLRKSWAEAQVAVDKLLKIKTPIHVDFFRYHWRRKCACWPAELRR